MLRLLKHLVPQVAHIAGDPNGVDELQVIQFIKRTTMVTYLFPFMDERYSAIIPRTRIFFYYTSTEMTIYSVLQLFSFFLMFLGWSSASAAPNHNS